MNILTKVIIAAFAMFSFGDISMAQGHTPQQRAQKVRTYRRAQDARKQHIQKRTHNARRQHNANHGHMQQRFPSYGRRVHTTYNTFNSNTYHHQTNSSGWMKSCDGVYVRRPVVTCYQPRPVVPCYPVNRRPRFNINLQF